MGDVSTFGVSFITVPENEAGVLSLSLSLLLEDGLAKADDLLPAVANGEEDDAKDAKGDDAPTLA